MREPEKQELMKLPWHGDMSDKDYFGLDSYDGTDAGHWWDQSQLKQWAKSPLDWASSLHVEPTPVMRFGTACHSLILGSGAPVEKAEHTPRSKVGQEEQADALKRGVTLLPADQFEAAQQMAAVAHPVFQDMMPGEPEVTMLARDTTQFRDVYLKGKADWIPLDPDDDGVWRIYDYKTTSMPLDDFGRTVFQGGYDIQAVFYLHLAHLCGITDGRERTGFGWVVQSKVPPYAFRIYRVDASDAQLTYAAELVDHLLADVARSAPIGMLSASIEALKDPAQIRLLCTQETWPLDMPQWAQDKRADQAEEFEVTHE